MGTYSREGDGEWPPGITVSSWRRVFAIVPKKSDHGLTIRPFSFAYTRTGEKYIDGQKYIFTNWLTPTEYTMMLLKGEGDATN